MKEARVNNKKERKTYDEIKLYWIKL